ncbi:hypothetical protein DFH09DRAFT_1359314, partial [Mycena vulgaris]
MRSPWDGSVLLASSSRHTAVSRRARMETSSMELTSAMRWRYRTTSAPISRCPGLVAPPRRCTTCTRRTSAHFSSRASFFRRATHT